MAGEVKSNSPWLLGNKCSPSAITRTAHQPTAMRRRAKKQWLREEFAAGVGLNFRAIVEWTR